MSVRTSTLPSDALLRSYAKQEGCFTDCYVTDISANISFADYVTAFYTTPLFKLERLILKIAARSPSTDAEAANLATAKTETFAAWTVEARSDTQLLTKFGSTRSWFMLEASDSGSRLYFGSAVLAQSGEKMGFVFHALLPFHKLYSRALLASAKRRLKTQST